MAIQAYKFTLALAVVLLATMLTSPPASAQVSDGRDKPSAAQCGCPSDGRDGPNATSSSEVSMQSAIDLMSDPIWQAHEYTWQGIRYVQINNTMNGTRFALLQIDETNWLIQADAQLPITGRTVYRDSKTEVIQYRHFNQDRWIVRPAG